MIDRILKHTQEGWIYWKLAIGKSSLQALAAAISVFVGGIAGVSYWADLKPMQQLALILSSLSAALLVINAFLDTTMAKLRKDHPDNNPPNQNPNEGTK